MLLIPQIGRVYIFLYFSPTYTNASHLALALIHVNNYKRSKQKNQSHDHSVANNGLFWLHHYMKTTHIPCVFDTCLYLGSNLGFSIQTKRFKKQTNAPSA